MATRQIANRRAGVLAVHSLDHFAIEVPELEEARRFYTAFGLDVRDDQGGIGLYTAGHPHRWGFVRKGGRKQLLYLSFGVFADDLTAFGAHFDALGVKRITPRREDLGGMWIEGFDGLPLNVRVAEKSSPDAKSVFEAKSVGPGVAGTVANSKAPKVHPRRLSHFAIFTTDVSAAVTFYERTLGLRLSDSSGPVAFMHGAHGSDHHMLALITSDHRGMHHACWDVASIQEVGLGWAQMARAGFEQGWGLGRHVLGANYFRYVRDPWGSYSEYSADIDYIPADCDWKAGHHAPEDSMFLWGPMPAEDFIGNLEPKDVR
jgi:catechol 2,3-dioxygenase-like lactoylglutathione lyase family enzyme